MSSTRSFPTKALMALILGVLIRLVCLKVTRKTGNFDGFLIHARKGLLRLRGPIAQEKKEGKVRILLFLSFLFFFLPCLRRIPGKASPSFSFVFLLLLSTIAPYYSFLEPNLREIPFCYSDIYVVCGNQDFELYHS